MVFIRMIRLRIRCAFIECVTDIDDSLKLPKSRQRLRYRRYEDKIDAARIANDAGCDMIIANGKDFHVIDDIMRKVGEGYYSWPIRVVQHSGLYRTWKNHQQEEKKKSWLQMLILKLMNYIIKAKVRADTGGKAGAGEIKEKLILNLFVRTWKSVKQHWRKRPDGSIVSLKEQAAQNLAKKKKHANWYWWSKEALRKAILQKGGIWWGSLPTVWQAVCEKKNRWYAGI